MAGAVFTTIADEDSCHLFYRVTLESLDHTTTNAPRLGERIGDHLVERLAGRDSPIPRDRPAVTGQSVGQQSDSRPILAGVADEDVVHMWRNSTRSVADSRPDTRANAEGSKMIAHAARSSSASSICHLLAVEAVRFLDSSEFRLSQLSPSARPRRAEMDVPPVVFHPPTRIWFVRH